MSKGEDRRGKRGQEMAGAHLSLLGVEMVEEMPTPVLLIPAGKGLFRVIWEKPVSGDFRGVLPGGRSVLAEVKTILGRNLQYKDLRPHQPVGLTKHAECGGLSLLIWVCDIGPIAMQWPIPGFEPGKGLTIEQAEELRVRSLT